MEIDCQYGCDLSIWRLLSRFSIQMHVLKTNGSYIDLDYDYLVISVFGKVMVINSNTAPFVKRLLFQMT